MSRTYKPFSGPFAHMLTEFLAQKRAIGYQYLAGYWVLRKFDSFSMDYTDHTGGRDLLQFCRAICSPGVWRSGAYPGGIRGNPQA